MASEPLIIDFVFSDASIEKLWRHQVEFEEVREAVLEDIEVEIRRVSDGRHGTRWMAKGRTASGRKLKVFMNPGHEEGYWYCITAWGDP